MADDATMMELHQLLHKYDLGDCLGQGAFGIVYACTKLSTKDQLAVKMIDKVETSQADIENEINMLKRLAHPCVVKLHEVFYEKVFICLVMDLYKGGDVIDGMTTHWKKKGMIAVPVCQSLIKMMFQGIVWLHSKDVIHRDLKGDNYLQDRKDISDPGCRIFLSDFGTVIDCKPGQMLKDKCGTKQYWAPEVYRAEYSLRADVWALGVVAFGLVGGKFPFASEKAVKSKKATPASRVGKDGQHFIENLLEKDEKDRPTAAEAIAHPFLVSVKSAAEVAEEANSAKDVGKHQSDSGGGAAHVKEIGANRGVQERRKDLVERMHEAKKKNDGTPEENKGGRQFTFKIAPHLVSKGFKVLHASSGQTVQFHWWTEKMCADENIVGDSEQCKDSSTSQEPQMHDDQIRHLLQKHHIDTDAFGKGHYKTLAAFVDEVRIGETRLMLDASQHKCLVRVVELVQLRIIHEGTKQYLVHAASRYTNGRMRPDYNRLPTTKKLPFENGLQTVERIIKTKLDLLDGKLKIDFSAIDKSEEDEESKHYPGVRTVYRKEVFECVLDVPESELAALGIGSPDGQFITNEHDSRSEFKDHFWSWMSATQCKGKGIVIKAPGKHADVDTLVDPPVGFEVEELSSFLHANKFDAAQFGKEGVKSLADFADELLTGESCLRRRDGDDGTLVRSVDVVILRLRNKRGDTLVRVSTTNHDGSVTRNPRLPAVKKRPDESMFWAAQRVLTKGLKISTNCVAMEPDNVFCVTMEAPSAAFGGLPTIYHRHIIGARLVGD